MERLVRKTLLFTVLAASAALLLASLFSIAGPGAGERAVALAHKVLLADTHIDAPYRLEEDGWRDLSQATPDRNFDRVKAAQGGVDLAFMTIYTPSALDASGGNTAQIGRARGRERACKLV